MPATQEIPGAGDQEVSIARASARRQGDTAQNGRKEAVEMNPYSGYQLYQAERPRTRAEILAGDARLGRQAAAVVRGSRARAGKASTPGIMAMNAIRAIAAQVTARAA
jgi:hypothetical protein